MLMRERLSINVLPQTVRGHHQRSGDTARMRAPPRTCSGRRGTARWHDCTDTVSTTVCYVCGNKCQNPENFRAHLAGQKHLARTRALWQLLHSGPAAQKWKGLTLTRMPALDLWRDAVVLMCGTTTGEVKQGVVSGVTSAERLQHMHIALGPRTEARLCKDDMVFKVTRCSCSV